MTQEPEFYGWWLTQMRQAVRDALLDLDAAGLNWKPLPAETNSLYTLAKHCAWVEQWWIGSVLAGQPFPWEGEDLEGQGADSADLLAWLDAAATTSQTVLAGLTADTLREERTMRRSDGSDRTISVHWIIVHTIEHYAEHIGQMGLTRQLWEAQRV